MNADCFLAYMAVPKSLDALDGKNLRSTTYLDFEKERWIGNSILIHV